MRIQLNKSIDLEQNVKRALGNEIPYSFSGDKKYAALIAFVCPKCGAELLAAWTQWYLSAKWGRDIESSDADKAAIRKHEEKLKTLFREEATSILQMDTCPLCGAALSREKGFYLEAADGENAGKSYGLDYRNLAHNNLVKKSSIATRGEFQSPIYPITLHSDARLFAFMKQQREESEKASAEKQIQDKIVICDRPFTAAKSEAAQKSIKSSSVKLQEYLFNLIQTEISIYSLTQRLATLYYQRYELNRLATASAVAPNYEKAQEIAELEKRIEASQAKKARYQAGEIGMNLPVEPEEPTYGTPGFFNKKKVLAENEALKAQYESEMKAYNDKLQSYQRQKERMIAIANAEISTIISEIDTIREAMKQNMTKPQNESPAFELKSIVDGEIAEAESLLEKLYECRNQLYAYDIIFSKYRKVVALSAFYEYLLAGRCAELGGPYGAYNLYESELRANLIVEKLDEIKRTQNMIHGELQKVNSNLKQLNNTLSQALTSIQSIEIGIANISANTDVIAHNTAVSAYYSKLNAELTDSMGYLVALK